MKFLAIIHIIALVFAGYFFIQNQQPQNLKDETMNWKTYTSNQLKFMIKYPNDWFFTEDTLTSFDKEMAKNGTLPKEPFQTCHFIPYDPPLFNVLTETIIQNSQPQIVKERVIDKSIQPQSDKNASNVYSIKQDDFSTVEVICIDQSEIYEAKIIQILSTFKFLE
ncbi:MAG: hypothetical protein Q7S14_03430 [bacterium]|nr:hypothetical protein [bacterium]